MFDAVGEGQEAAVQFFNEHLEEVKEYFICTAFNSVAGLGELSLPNFNWEVKLFILPQTCRTKHV